MRGFGFISISLLAAAALAGCSDEPHGQWVAKKRIEVLKEKGNLDSIAFFLEEGEICALSDKWHVLKEMRYKEVSCPKGRGWITSSGFEELKI